MTQAGITPNFALDLSEDGIELLHRAPDGAGWYREGRVSFATDDIGEGLAKFRARAIELEGEGFQTKLILPTSQLLFTSVPAGTDIASALEDRTPYRIDQLSYDSVALGGEIKIVAVALETLGEAEGFIAPHQLNPVGFTAVPEPGRFLGEPMLGGTLAGDDHFQADTQPVKIITKPKAAAPTFEAPKTEALKADNPAAVTTDVAPLAASQNAADVDATDALGEATPAQPAVPAQPQAGKESAAPAAEKQTPDSPHKAASFTSRRQGAEQQAEQPEGAAAGVSVKELSTQITAPKLGSALPPEKASAPPKNKVAAPASKVAPKATPVVASKAPTPLPVPNLPVPNAPRDTGRKTAPPAAVAAKMAKDRDSLAQMDAKSRRGKPRFLGLIMTAILLVCLGLAALLSSYILPDTAIGKWFGGGGENEPTESVAATDAPDTLEVVALQELAIAPPPQQPFEVEDEFTWLTLDDQNPSFNAPAELAAAPEPELPGPAEMTETAAQTAYAVSGIWQHSDTLALEATDTGTLDSLYVASLDPNPAFEDAPALLPQIADDGETALVSFTKPPPPGFIFDLDVRGLVRPSPQGTLNPNGITITLGRPIVAAIPRPSGDTAPESAPLAQAAPDTPAIQPPTPSAQQTRLATISPASRPADLVERQDRATLGGRSRPELAQIRPQQRPVSAQAQAVAIARALLEVEAADEAQIQAALAAATRRAVSVSLRAQPRPRNFAEIVTAARNAAPAESTAQVQTASATRATGPAVARSSRVNPTGPVSSRVARAATDNNVIALGKVSLVGVFGTSSSRRALVRMPNGRFKKLSIGDAVDGGRVAAIDSNSLRYTRRGRTVTLQMPSS